MPAPRSPLARDSCQLVGEEFGDTASESCRAGLMALASRARTRIRAGGPPAETLDRLNGFFFQHVGLQTDGEPGEPGRLLPPDVLATQHGNCVGLATVYLILAEELDLPIHAVAAPDHVFLRWDDGRYRRNIELLEGGRDASDDDYIREMQISAESIRRGVFMRNLTRKEFLGFLYQNRGVLASQRGDYRQSERDYGKALRLNPNLVAAYYNRGKDRLAQKDYERAIRDFTRALELNPFDSGAMRSRGLALERLGRMEEAMRDVNLAGRLEPAPALQK